MSERNDESLAGLSIEGGHGLRKWLLLAFKIGVTVAVLAVLASRADWSSVGRRFADAAPAPLLLGLLANAASMGLAAERWYRALKATGLAYRRRVLIRIVIVAIFIGQVLPGGVGADAVRGWLTYRAGRNKPQAVITAVLLDRVLALAAAVLLLIAALPRLAALAPPAFAWSADLAAAGLAGGLAVLATLDLIPLPRILKLPPVVLLLDQTRLLRSALPTSGTAWSGAFAIAVHLMTVVSVVCYAAAIGVPLSLAQALVVVPVAIIAAALPVSLNGWGVREGAMAAGLALYGVDTGAALVVSMMMGLAMMLLSLPGAPLWLTLRRSAA